MNRYLIFFMVFWASLCLQAQQKVRFTHYTSDDGLSQNRVMSILQDKKGFMWFATWDGLNRFDGRHFKVYKGLAGDPNGFTNNRLNTMQEDSFGFLWILTNDFQIYRFNPENEEFQRLSYNPDPSKVVVSKTIQAVRMIKGKDVCLLTFTDGCYLVQVSDDGQNIVHIKYLSRKIGNLAGDLVREVFKDLNNQFWFLTDKGLTLYDPVKETSTHFFHQFQDETGFFSHLETKNNLFFGSDNGQIWSWSMKQRNFHLVDFHAGAAVNGFCPLNNGKILIITRGDGVFLTDKSFHILSHENLSTTPALSSNLIHSFYKDMAGDVWLEADAPGVVLYVTNENRFVRFQPKSDEQFGLAQMQPNFFVVEDTKNHLWVHPRSGGFSEFFRKEMALKPFYNDPSDPNRRFFNTMHAAFYDRQGTLWLSTRSPGLEKCSIQQTTFNFTYVPSMLQLRGGSEVRTIFEDRHKRIWAADREGGIVMYSAKGERIGYLDNQGSVTSKRSTTNYFAYDIMSDKKGRIWIASKGAGVLLLEEKDPNGLAYTVRRFNESLPPADRPNSNNFYALLEDQKGRIWAGSYGGGLNLVEEKGGTFRFIHFRNELKNYPIDRCRNIRNMAKDRQGIIWVGTVNGIVAFDANFKKPADIRFYEYRKIGTDPNSLRINDVHYIYVDDAGDRWFGTFGGGLNKLSASFKLGESPSFKTYTMNEGLPSDIVLSIQDDLQGYLWLFSENSITRFDSHTGDMDIYNKNNGLQGVTFSESSCYRLRSGEIYAGTTTGFYKFNPSKAKTTSIVPRLVFTRFILLNKEANIGEKNSPLTKNVDDINKISLSNRQNVFTIEFAALDYRAPENIQYAYRLDPVDQDWTKSSKLNSVNYTNLSPGKYVFRVKSTDSEGFWMNNERQIELHIRPSFWQTWIAILLYVLFGLALISFGLYFFTMILRLRSKVEVEHKVSNLKINFFTDISHELRTPLTLISGPVEHLLNDENLSGDTRTLLIIVQRNIDRMLRLINQLLDFRKIQDKKMQLKVQEVPFGPFIASVAANFNMTADEKRIDFKLIDQTEGATVWLDTDKLDTIVYNLLSNAFKFTQPGKSITLTSFMENEHAIFSVADTGAGISVDKQSRLFERFFSYDETSKVRGTGIGLHLAKELVDMHGGSISVNSEEGKGTTFEVRFKLGTAHFDNQVTIVHTNKPDLTDAFAHPVLPLPNEHEGSHDDGSTGNQPLLLVVEDNSELRTFLTSVLSGKYRVAEAADGHVAWSMMSNLMPDFVITDLMMPVMDGLELTKLIKQDDRTCHIPVIMLTAKSDMVTQMECIQAGVNDFIAKPFNAVFLEAKIENIFKQRFVLQEKFRHDIFSVQPASAERLNLQSSDSIFLKRILDFMEENMSNSELTVDQLVSVVGMGRTVFFNKLKGILGMSPIEFIKETRIKRAAQLLDTGQFNVSEVSFQIGMNDARYFSKCFKQKYGMTPSEYKNKTTPKPL
ncbi:MAG TPA: two-component regulator propeller domain-containing protein [Bacteroidales bacterium]|nr:two-component regulator propeller domain-containing protein [Bacteroidales bacterium]